MRKNSAQARWRWRRRSATRPRSRARWVMLRAQRAGGEVSSGAAAVRVGEQAVELLRGQGEAHAALDETLREGVALGEVRRPALGVDGHARGTQRVDGLLEHRPHLRVDGEVRVVEPGRHPVAGEAIGARRRQLQPPGDAGRLVGTGEHVEREREVGGAAGERADDTGVGLREHARWRRDVAACRDDAERRLESVDATEVGGDADGAAQVAAELEWRHPRRHRGSRTARRAAGGARHVPRVVRRAEQLVVRLAVAGPRGQVRLADDDRAGGPEPGDRRRVLVGDVVAQLGGAGGRAHARGREAVLHRHREPVQPAEHPTLGDGGVGRGVPHPSHARCRS